MGLFESHVPIDSITVMVQKEVADRMQVGPGTKDYGALSLAVQFYAKPEIVANVPPNCFMPRPNVGSAVIRLTRHEEVPVQVDDEKLMFHIIRASLTREEKHWRTDCRMRRRYIFPRKRYRSVSQNLASRLPSGGGTYVRAVCSAFQYYWKQTEK